MVANTETYKTSYELFDIAREMLLVLSAKHDLTNGERSMVIHQMEDAHRFASEDSHIERMMKHD